MTTRITGSVRQLCTAASETCQTLGYTPVVLTASLACEAREAGAFLGAVAQYHQDSARSLAFIAGGETVVHLTGTGKGGRNQEIALAGRSFWTVLRARPCSPSAPTAPTAPLTRQVVSSPEKQPGHCGKPVWTLTVF